MSFFQTECTWAHDSQKLFKTITAFYLLLLIVTFDSANASSDDFVTVWESDQNQITMPIYAESGTYRVDWGDGNFDYGVTEPIRHTYDQDGTYTIRVSAESAEVTTSRYNARFHHGFQGPRLLEVQQWGSLPWSTMEGAFFNCSNLTITATDAPNLTYVSSMKSMFHSAYRLNSNINHWDVSNVTDFSAIFFQAYNFNQPLNSWDVSNATNMDFAFASARDFDQPLDKWDVSNVTRMSHMFSLSLNFNQPLESWNVSNVLLMLNMFSSAENFNQPLNSWDVSNATVMQGMFQSSDFNHPLDKWDVSNVTRMSSMFRDTENFNQPLSSWDVSNVINMSNMFDEATVFNQTLESWNVSNVTGMRGMFSDAQMFNQHLNSWDVSNVTEMSEMFSGAITFNQSLKDWDVASVTTMNKMFTGSNLSTDNYDNLLESWSQLPVQYGVPLASPANYCAAGDARRILISVHGWKIDDPGNDCSSTAVDTCVPIVSSNGSITMICL